MNENEMQIRTTKFFQKKKRHKSSIETCIKKETKLGSTTIVLFIEKDKTITILMNG